MPAADLPEAVLGAPTDFVAAARPEDLVYVVLNVGDGDCQLVLLPERAAGGRPVVVVDVIRAKKLLALLDALERRGVLAAGFAVDLVVATHPHDDHIGGMASFLAALRRRIQEFWEPGYWHTSGAYHEMMREVEEQGLDYLQPAAGTSKWLGDVRLTVLAPGVSLRGRFDSYGIDINNSSIALKLEFPAARVVERTTDRTYVKLQSTQTLILGADAQTLSWAQALVDFPQLGPQRTAVTDALRMARGSEPLSADVLKVPHHGSKHGINLELMEEMHPAVSIVSCGRELGKYNFPHAVTQDIMREALEQIAGDPAKPRSPDHTLGIHYTGSLTDAGRPAGSVGVIVPRSGGRSVYRFGDAPDGRVDIGAARRVG